MEYLIDTLDIKTTSVQISDRSVGARIVDLSYRGKYLCVHLADGRKIDAPFSWFPWLLAAAAPQRKKFELIDSGRAVYWPDLDQHISLQDLMSGALPCSQCWYRITYFK